MLWVLVGCAVAGVIGCGLGGCRTAPQLTGQQEYGRSLYNGYCAACHETNQLNLKPVPPELHGMFARGHLSGGGAATDEAVRGVILRGRNKMPAFEGRLTGEEVGAVVAYLHGGIK
jgi:mono/diheme cytochrome c family protein